MGRPALPPARPRCMSVMGCSPRWSRGGFGGNECVPMCAPGGARGVVGVEAGNGGIVRFPWDGRRGAGGV